MRLDKTPLAPSTGSLGQGGNRKLSFSHRIILASLAIFAATYHSDAESPATQGAVKDRAETIEVACGSIEKENCSIVVPEISAKASSRGLRLKPLESGGSLESLNALCEAKVMVAIVQEDALVERMNRPDCAGEIRMLGAPLYPYEGLLIVRADTRWNKFPDMVKNPKGGNIVRIAAGGPTSGGELTLRNMLANAPKWKQIVDIQPDKLPMALDKLRDRQIDAVFVMDSPQSTLLNQVQTTVDPKTKHRLFKFIDFRPDEAMRSGLRRLGVYGVVTIEKRWLNAVKTISSPAVIAIREDLYRNDPNLSNKIRKAAEDSLPAIAARAGAPPNWRQEIYRP